MKQTHDTSYHPSFGHENISTTILPLLIQKKKNYYVYVPFKIISDHEMGQSVGGAKTGEGGPRGRVVKSAVS